MRFTTLIWKEIRERPTAMLTGLLTIALGAAALVAIRNVTFFSELAVARELDALGANVLVLPKGATVQDYYSADLHGKRTCRHWKTLWCRSCCWDSAHPRSGNERKSCLISWAWPTALGTSPAN